MKLNCPQCAKPMKHWTKEQVWVCPECNGVWIPALPNTTRSRVPAEAFMAQTEPKEATETK